VSAKHAKIQFIEKHTSIGSDCAFGPVVYEHLLSDCGSMNGTFVNSQRLDRRVYQLSPGDTISFGRTDKADSYVFQPTVAAIDIEDAAAAVATAEGDESQNMLADAMEMGDELLQFTKQEVETTKRELERKDKEIEELKNTMKEAEKVRKVQMKAVTEKATAEAKRAKTKAAAEVQEAEEKAAAEKAGAAEAKKLAVENELGLKEKADKLQAVAKRERTKRKQAVLRAEDAVAETEAMAAVAHATAAEVAEEQIAEIQKKAAEERAALEKNSAEEKAEIQRNAARLQQYSEACLHRLTKERNEQRKSIEMSKRKEEETRQKMHRANQDADQVVKLYEMGRQRELAMRQELESLKDTRKLRILSDWAERNAFDEVVVPDTNIWMHSFERFIAVWKQKRKGRKVGILIPRRVLGELDGLKKNKGETGNLARKANREIQEYLRVNNSWCSQSAEHEESIRNRHFSGISPDQMKRDGRPDDEIYYCWDEFREVSPCMVVLLSADNNLKSKLFAKKFERNAAILGNVQDWSRLPSP
jgi:pSer/pThr/pTyr-binding forkhead associated (FHA) protein